MNVTPSIFPAFFSLRMIPGAKRVESEKLLCAAIDNVGTEYERNVASGGGEAARTSGYNCMASRSVRLTRFPKKLHGI